MVGIGTGNTKHCIEKLVSLLDRNAKALPLENDDIIDHIKSEKMIVLGYPTQFSNAPFLWLGILLNPTAIYGVESRFYVLQS